MTTVVDPLGTPTVIYNRSGTAIVTMMGGTAFNGAAGNDAPPITRVSQVTVVLVETSVVPGVGYNIYARLPADAEIGDVVEVYAPPPQATNPRVFPNVGESIVPRPVSTGTNYAAGCDVDFVRGGIAFRKVSSTLWMPIGAV
jgi:hypothetical protein